METVLPWEVKREYAIKEEAETNPEYGCSPYARNISNHLRFGLINLDKPPGPSSHEVVAWVRKILGISSAGHGGTLEA